MNPLLTAPLAALVLVAAAPAAPQAQRVLDLPAALALAEGEQPSVAAYERDAAASEQAAVAARSLPDPQLAAGIQNLPVTGRDALNPTIDSMTMYTIGVMREQVRRSKREAEAARLTAEALVSQGQASAQERQIRRAVMRAWIDAVEAQARQRLLDRLVGDLRAGLRVAEAGVPTGAATSSLALQMQAEIALGEAQLADARGAEARARAELRRWIGAAALRPLPDAVPDIALPVGAGGAPDLSVHPTVMVAEAQAEAARRQIDAARADRRPDISWSVMYGFRPRFGDMASVQVTIPLQTNRKQRQDRRVAEAEARVEAATLRAEDARRELQSAYAAALADYRSAAAQLDLIDREALPALEASFKAAEARYSAGAGSLDQPFAIVRRYVEVAVQSEEARARKARAAAEILYATGEAAR